LESEKQADSAREQAAPKRLAKRPLTPVGAVPIGKSFKPAATARESAGMWTTLKKSEKEGAAFGGTTAKKMGPTEKLLRG